MSFGFSPSDILAVLNITKKTFDGWKNACGDYAEITGSLDNLLILLQGVQDEASKPHSVLCRTKRDQQNLRDVLSTCDGTVRELDAIIVKYKQLGSSRSRQHNWKRLRFGTKNLDGLRVRLQQHETVLSAYLNTVGLGSLANIERDVNALSSLPTQIHQIMEDLAAEIRAGRRESSILSTYEDDEKAVWRQFRRELVGEGISSSVIYEHKPRIRRYIRELAKGGMLDEDDEPIQGNSSILEAWRTDLAKETALACDRQDAADTTTVSPPLCPADIPISTESLVTSSPVQSAHSSAAEDESAVNNFCESTHGTNSHLRWPERDIAATENDEEIPGTDQSEGARDSSVDHDDLSSPRAPSELPETSQGDDIGIAARGASELESEDDATLREVATDSTEKQSSISGSGPSAEDSQTTTIRQTLKYQAYCESDPEDKAEREAESTRCRAQWARIGIPDALENQHESSDKLMPEGLSLGTASISPGNGEVESRDPDVTRSPRNVVEETLRPASSASQRRPAVAQHEDYGGPSQENGLHKVGRSDAGSSMYVNFSGRDRHFDIPSPPPRHAQPPSMRRPGARYPPSWWTSAQTPIPPGPLPGQFNNQAHPQMNPFQPNTFYVPGVHPSPVPIGSHRYYPHMRSWNQPHQAGVRADRNRDREDDSDTWSTIAVNGADGAFDDLMAPWNGMAGYMHH